MSLLTCPALLMLLADAPAAAWLPSDPAGWLLPLGMLALGASIGFMRRAPERPAVEQTAVERGTSLPSFRRSIPDLESELERTRRVGRSLAVLVVRLAPDSVKGLESDLSARLGTESGAAIQCTVHTVFALVGAILDECLRDIDLATSDLSNRRYVVVLPEAGRAEAEDTARRMAELIMAQTGVGIRAGISEFRTDALLLEDLVAKATEVCDGTSADVADEPGAARARRESGELHFQE